MEKLNHRPKLAPDEQAAKIAFLRKQRDGLIIGTYRNMLADVYKTIAKSLCDNGTCCFLAFCEEHGTNAHEINVLKEYCLELEQLKYIQINESGNILITKPLDF